MTATTAPMSIRLEPSARQKLKEIAARQKRTAHALATEAITALIEQKEREHAFNQSCIASYNQYKETGLHVTHNLHACCHLRPGSIRQVSQHQRQDGRQESDLHHSIRN